MIVLVNETYCRIGRIRKSFDETLGNIAGDYKTLPLETRRAMIEDEDLVQEF